jgi:aminobenzoyl-glutamate utilization protein B
MSKARKSVLRWVDGHSADLSDGCSMIWHYGETAWREYKSARWYVDRLRAEEWWIPTMRFDAKPVAG